MKVVFRGLLCAGLGAACVCAAVGSRAVKPIQSELSFGGYGIDSGSMTVVLNGQDVPARALSVYRLKPVDPPFIWRRNGGNRRFSAGKYHSRWHRDWAGL